MSTSSPPRQRRKQVFVVHGRNEEAREEMDKFLNAVGVSPVLFGTIQARAGSQFVADIVLDGIRQVDAVIVIFTPDEQSALYDPRTGRLLAHEEPAGWRWQARPNVLFEAGVAYGSGKHTILTTVGCDVQLFSDVGGMHFLQLDKDGSKRQLFDRLQQALGPLQPRRRDWETSAEAGDFRRCLHCRWKQYYDEAHELEKDLRNRVMRRGRNAAAIDLLAVFETVVASNPTDWSRAGVRALIQAIKNRFGEPIADDSYWWLIVLGVLRFDNIEEWGVSEDATWDDSCDYAQLTSRGAFLIERLRAKNPSGQARPRRRRSSSSA